MFRNYAEPVKNARVACHYKPMAPFRSPVVDQPFERMGIDLVGPLTQATAGHHYVLTMVNYGARYPEAIPLRQTNSQTIAAELMTIFSRVKIPKEILSDWGANLTSKHIKELYWLLGVQPIWISSYHPKTNWYGGEVPLNNEDIAKKDLDQNGYEVGQSLNIYPLCLPRSADWDDRFQPFWDAVWQKG